MDNNQFYVSGPYEGINGQWKGKTHDYNLRNQTTIVITLKKKKKNKGKNKKK